MLCSPGARQSPRVSDRWPSDGPHWPGVRLDPARPVSRDAVLTSRANVTAARVLELGPRLPEPRPATAPPGFHLLAKPTGAVCNLDCTYCFFLSKEALYPGSQFRMADDLLEPYIRQLLESHLTPT